MGGATVEGWLTKRGSGFPHKWQRRYFVFLAASSTLYYFAADGDEGGKPTAKGEVVVQLIRPTEGEPLGLTFEVSSASRAGGRQLSGKNTCSPANKPRAILARAPNVAEHARWLEMSVPPLLTLSSQGAI